MKRQAEASDPAPSQGAGLQIDQDLAFQRRTWIVERAGWAGMGLLVLAALAGLFGGGPLSQATAGAPGGALWLEYDRFGRLLSPATLRVHIGAAGEGTARIWLDRAYLSDVKLEGVVPEPDSVEAASDGLVFVFRVAEPGPPSSVTFDLQPERFGLLTGHAALVSAGAGVGETDPRVRFRQFIYP